MAYSRSPNTQTRTSWSYHPSQFVSSEWAVNWPWLKRRAGLARVFSAVAFTIKTVRVPAVDKYSVEYPRLIVVVVAVEQVARCGIRLVD